MSEHAELIETAWSAYLADFQIGNPLASPWTAGLLIYPGENNLDKSGQRIVAYVEGDMGDEDPPNSGNRWADVTIELRTPFNNSSGAVSPLVSHQSNAAALQSAILSITLPDDLSDAIEGFTCFGLSQRTQLREQKENYWSTGWKVKLYSCPSAIPD